MVQAIQQLLLLQWLSCKHSNMHVTGERVTSYLFSLLGLLIVACGGSQLGAHAGPWDHGAPVTPVYRKGWYMVEFTSASLSPRRSDGSSWHTTKADNGAVVIGGLFGLAVGNPAAGLAIGKALASSGGDPLAPAPYVALKLGGTTYRISAVDRGYSVEWDQPIVVNAQLLNDDSQVVIQIMDAVDDSVIAQTELTLAQLVSQPARTLTNLGPVASLDFRIEPYKERARSEYDLVVPARATLQMLAEGQYPSWQPIPVWNGDSVAIAAIGTVCPSSLSRDCFDPNGAAGRWRGYSYDGFKDVPHAALVAEFPGENSFVGPAAQLPVEQSGMILLFVNDTDVSNNTGEFRAHVTVDPPP